MKEDFVNDLMRPVYGSSKVHNGCLNRDGFIFHLSSPNVYDDLIIRYPADAKLWSPKLDISSKTLEEHIQLINQYQLEKVTVICNDLSFILRCPSIKQLTVHPSDDAGGNFDYSPLYQMPNLRDLSLTMSCGESDDYWYSVDYQQFRELVSINACGKGHNGYELVPSLEKLKLSNSKKHISLENISCSPKLKRLELTQCNTQTLDGIGACPQLETMGLYYNRSLRDISALIDISDTLKRLCIESCPKITDFSVLNFLVNLEHLQLYGGNNLPNLEFLQYMQKLKTFSFTMNVEDGDLSRCMALPYATCKNRRHYNLKDSQLPKQ